MICTVNILLLLYSQNVSDYVSLSYRNVTNRYTFFTSFSEHIFAVASIRAGVGNDFFPGRSRGYWVLELRGYQGGGFSDPKIDQF